MKKAITRIELLIVIASITLLLGTFLPALGNAHRHGYTMVCKNNLKTIVWGAFLWAFDHNGWAIAADWQKDPNENETESSLLPYITSQCNRRDIRLICPASRDVNFFQVDDDFTYPGNKRRYTYAANGYITLNMAPYGEGSPGMQGPTGRGSGGVYGPNNVYWTVHGVTPMVQIRKPAKTVFFIDHEYFAAMSWTFNPTKPYSSFPEDYRYKTRWHNIKPGSDYGFGMIAWVDGHCSMEPFDFAAKYKDPVSNKTIERWKYYFYDH
jgi:hypothetical protein